MTKLVYVQVKVPGFHHWPDASKEVEFLSEPHRHMFSFMLAMKVTTARQYEFFLLQQELHNYLNELYDEHESGLGYDFGASSCEELATATLEMFQTMGMVYSVEVSEDDENGSVVYAD